MNGISIRKTIVAFILLFLWGALPLPGCGGAGEPEAKEPESAAPAQKAEPLPPPSSEKPEYAVVNVTEMTLPMHGHSITVPAFKIGTYEVQVDEFRRCVQAGICGKDDFKTAEMGKACNFSSKSGKNGNHPMNCINWFGARDFCRWIGGDLPVSEEWEIAASGPDHTIYPWGDESLGIGCDRMTSSSCVEKETRPVGSAAKGASQAGAFDMSGNVAEWVLDSRDAVRGDSHALLRVVRGGSFHQGQAASELKATHPGVVASGDDMKPNIGFRCALGTGLMPTNLNPDLQSMAGLRPLYRVSLKGLAESYLGMKQQAASDAAKLQNLRIAMGDQLLLLSYGILRRNDAEGCRQYSYWSAITSLIKQEGIVKEVGDFLWKIVGDSLLDCTSNESIPLEGRARWLREWASLCQAAGSPEPLQCNPAKMEKESKRIIDSETKRMIKVLEEDGVCGKGIRYCMDNYEETELKQANPFGGPTSSGVSLLKIKGTAYQMMGWPEDSAAVMGGSSSMTLKWKLIEDCGKDACGAEKK